MKKIKIYQVDAFTDKLFGGNPAAVCIFDEWPEDELLQNIAAENNLAETAFLVKNNTGYDIRWFTPTVEVALCGHATLAGAYVVFNHLDFAGDTVSLQSRYSGVLKVTKNEQLLTLDFPADTISKSDIPDGLKEALGTTEIIEAYKGKTDYLLILKDKEQVIAVNPDMYLLNQIEARGIIITAKGNEVDFVSRFFGPRVGVPEDPVTGSAHTTLIPYWSRKLNKKKLTAMQLSKRGGKLNCELADNRVFIGGEAILYLEGIITITD
ncbi:MAG: PhzF family phenazine biosynthesis protein [Candidatus Cyclobacteriaceae bacterium M2_1C_046]